MMKELERTEPSERNPAGAKGAGGTSSSDATKFKPSPYATALSEHGISRPSW